jgi:hypothetical protein
MNPVRLPAHTFVPVQYGATRPSAQLSGVASTQGKGAEPSGGVPPTSQAPGVHSYAAILLFTMTVK